MAAVAQVRKLREAKEEKTLSQLIDQAGQVNAEKSRLDGLYTELRAQIEAAMPMGDSDRIEVMGNEFRAVRDYPTKKRTKVKELFKYSQAIFWRLATVPVSVLESVVGKEKAHELTEMETSDKPSLRIDPIKKR